MLRSRARSSLLWGCSACALVAIAAAFPQPLVPGRTLLAPRVGGARVRFNTRPMCALSCSRAAQFHPGTGPGGRSRVRALKLLMMGIVAILWCPATGEGENAATRTTRAGPQVHALRAAACWLRCSAARMVTAPRTPPAASAAEATAAASAVTGPLHVRQGFVFVLSSSTNSRTQGRGSLGPVLCSSSCSRCRRACWLCACIRACLCVWISLHAYGRRAPFVCVCVCVCVCLCVARTVLALLLASSAAGLWAEEKTYIGSLLSGAMTTFFLAMLLSAAGFLPAGMCVCVCVCVCIASYLVRL